MADRQADSLLGQWSLDVRCSRVKRQFIRQQRRRHLQNSSASLFFYTAQLLTYLLTGSEYLSYFLVTRVAIPAQLSSLSLSLSFLFVPSSFFGLISLFVASLSTIKANSSDKMPLQALIKTTCLSFYANLKGAKCQHYFGLQKRG